MDGVLAALVAERVDAEAEMERRDRLLEAGGFLVCEDCGSAVEDTFVYQDQEICGECFRQYVLEDVKALRNDVWHAFGTSCRRLMDALISRMEGRAGI
jgi:hypothetical protein